MIEDLNDSYKVYYPPMGALGTFVFKGMGFMGRRFFRYRDRLFGGHVEINERIIEYPMIFRWLRDSGTILDVGCVSSRLPFQLASMGREVHGLDLRPFSYTHPNFHFHQADLFKWNPGRKFDSILLISVVEHFGIGFYGDEVKDDADYNVTSAMRRLMAEDGQMLITVPFGRAEIAGKHRIYDLERLKRTFRDFHWEREAYFQRKNGSWVPGVREEIEKIPSPNMPVNGVAILDLRLPRT